MWILGFMFAAGLCLAGSDGPWFPWANIAGIAMLVVVCVIIARLERKKFGTKYSAQSYNK